MKMPLRLRRDERPAVGRDRIKRPNFDPPRVSAFSCHRPVPSPVGGASKSGLAEKARIPMSIVLQGVTRRYGRQAVVNDVSLEVGDGEFFVLLGSSGSGKTTILNIIAGLTEADQGQVLLHGRQVTGLPPQARNVGFVFQHYALFQHMNVAQNIEFGLQVRRLSGAERRKLSLIHI